MTGKMNDLLSECMSDLQTKDQAAFTATFCERCRQPGCHRAKWSGDKFGARVANQVNRLFHAEQADPTSSRYEHIHDFKSMFDEAMKLEISDRRGDWAIPQTPDFEKPLPKHMVYPGPVDGLSESVETNPPVVTPPGVTRAISAHANAGVIQVRSGNIPVPAGGIIVGGAAPSLKPGPDPWAVPHPIKGMVKPGATIKMGEDR